MKRTLLALLTALFVVAPAALAFDPLQAIGSIVSNATATTKFEIADLQGTWKYSAPAISFASDDALSQIGGIGAATAIENQLAPYYKKLSLTSAEITFDAEGNFEIKLKRGTLKGVATKQGDDGTLLFTFQGSITGRQVGELAARATKSATGELTLTFDASRLIQLVKTISTYANNSTISTISQMLESYDNIYIGAKFK
ncbi:MAG: DUF4923 family protein, partial [Muribaculaceae bacterium]